MGWVSTIVSIIMFLFHLRKNISQSIQLLSHLRLFATPWSAAHQLSLSITISWSLLKLKSIESVMPSNHLIFCCPLLLLPSIFPSLSVFSGESVLRIRWPKYWSFIFSIRVVCFRTEWFDLAVQGTPRIFSSTTVQKDQFFISQPS